MKDQILEEIKTEGPKPIYLLYGDEYLVREIVESLVTECLDPHLRDTNLVVIDGAHLSLGELSSELFTPTLFGGNRVVLVRETTAFMGRTDHRKLLSKVTDAWTANERKKALRAFGQLLSLAGLDSSRLEQDSDWIGDIVGTGQHDKETQTLLKVARAFLDEGRTVGKGTEESALEELLQSPFPDDVVLVFTAPAADKRKKLVKAIEKRGRLVECQVRRERYGEGIERSYFEDRVRQVLEERGKRLAGGALDAMHARSGSDMRKLQAELEKLIAYVGDRPEVTQNDVEALFEDFHKAAYFEFTSALKTANLDKCLPALHENLKLVEHPLQTLAGIANEFRNLMAARELLFTLFRTSWKPRLSYHQFRPILTKVRKENAEHMDKGKLDLLSMKDFRIYSYLRDAQRFPMEALIRIMEAILEADIMMKSTRVGSVSPESIVENLVLQICATVDRGRASGR